MPAVAKTRTPFAQRLLRLRKASGFTQMELAHRTGISRRVVALYETKIKSPSADVVLRLAKALDVSVDQMMGRKTVTQMGPLIKNKRLLKKLKDVDQLPLEDQKTILRHIDDYLKAKNSNLR